MTRRVEWAESALADLLGQIEYIAADNPDAAARVAAAIRKTSGDLGVFTTGRPGRVTGTYEKPVRGLPYVIAYALSASDETVLVLRVIHTARAWREDTWPG